DVAWGLGFVYVALITLFISSNFGTVQNLATALTCIWGLRLAIHIGSRNVKKSEDARYQIFRDKWKDSFLPNIYVRIFLLQGALILAISTASVGVIASDEPASKTTYLGFLIWTFGIAFESISDWQLRSFLKKKKVGEIMQSGLWRYSRHPNYFGEITVWVGAGLAAVSLGSHWGLIGPVVISFLILKISGIPPLEKRYKDNPKYQAYKKRTSSLFPLPPKSR
ncbi:DUF1295 domain-containing protein, partial [Candidatus Saccharibacteria bacterium]|nr:DUF1295 domain-containing protein [Candidatus Saccharibacteria bacterium]